MVCSYFDIRDSVKSMLIHVTLDNAECLTSYMKLIKHFFFLLISLITSIHFSTGSSGDITFTGLAPGRHYLRVSASNGREDRALEGRRIEISADPSMCMVNLINDGVRVDRDTVRVDFVPMGPAEIFSCQLDQEEPFFCKWIYSRHSWK